VTSFAVNAETGSKTTSQFEEKAMFKKTRIKQVDNRKEILLMSDQLKAIARILDQVFGLTPHAQKVADLGEQMTFMKPSVSDVALKKQNSIKKEIDDLRLLIGRSKNEINSRDLDFIIKNIEMHVIERSELT
jgi:hypothetical protein